MPDGSGVRTTEGEYREEGVLIAAGAWSSSLQTRLCRLTDACARSSYRLSPRRPLIGSILRHGHTYLLQRHDRELIAGSSTEYVGFDRAIDEGVVSDIHSRASELLPELAALTPGGALERLSAGN